MIDIIAELKRIQNMSAAETFDQSTDSLEAISNAIAAVIAALGQLGRPEIEHFEGWQDEMGIDFTLWNLTHPATTPTIRGAGVAPMAGGLVATVDMILNETGRIVSTFRSPISPDLWGVNTILRLTHFEFVMAVQNPANLDNTLCFWGLSPNNDDDRADDNIIGFIQVADAINCITDLAGAETLTATATIQADKNKYRITIMQTAALVGTVLFYVNETLVATHITNLPNLPMYMNWFFDTEGTGGSVNQLGINRLWTEDYQRP